MGTDEQTVLSKDVGVVCASSKSGTSERQDAFTCRVVQQEGPAPSIPLVSSWDSILSLVIAVGSLFYVRSIKTNIINFRRKQRLRQLVEDVLRIPDDAVPLSDASRSKLEALKRNTPLGVFVRFTARGRAIKFMHGKIDAGNPVEIKEAVHDWNSHSEHP